MRRLFVGVELDDATRGACAGIIERLRATGFAAKYEASNKLHLTLAFLGNVETVRVDDLKIALGEAAARFEPFDLTLDKLGAFPHERKPRVVYVGAREQGAAFRTLAQSVREGYARRGFVFEDDAVAHVTIARIKDPQRPLPAVDLTPARFRVGGAALFESLLDKQNGTSRYEVLFRVTASADR